MQRILLLIVMSLAAVGAAQAQATDDSLYQAFGEKAGIQRVMEDFVPRLKADPRIGAFFKEVNAEHLVTQLTDQLCLVSGGPCAYEGVPMKQAHAELGIAKKDFNALVELLQDSMDAKGIPFAAQNRMLARLAPMHRDIVTK
ncbi:MAG: group 1 truncated hemoglobin [Burkholderiales bacterium]|nr:group 1 truncated hemoglobin [Burkholderiales bacterium]